MNIRRLATGPAEAALLTELERRGISVFSERRDAGVLADQPRARLHGLVHQLARKGWLLRIEPGKYLVVPRAARGGWSEHPFVVAAGIAPARHYVSYWSALVHHGLTEQIPRLVYAAVVAGPAKRPVVFQGWEYRFVRIAERKYFGYEEQEFSALNGAATVAVRVADPEKAVLDCLENEAAGGGFPEVSKAIRRGADEGRFSVERFAEHAARLGSHPVAARLGYLLDRLTDLDSGPLQGLVRHGGWAPYLSAGYPREGAPLDRKWHLRVNVPEWRFDDEAVA